VPEYATGLLRSKNRDVLTAKLNDLLSSAGSEEWIERLNKAGVPCGRIYSIDQVFADPQVQHLRMVETVESPHYQPLRLVAQGVRLSRTPSRLHTRPPEMGEHTAGILSGLGYSAEQIADLRKRDVI
jgi:crotonobetainyl-CoA:carnitine CoA-transferase CaiB-like acyl-CoA transferase